MPIEMNWHPELENVVQWKFHAEWSWSEFADTFRREKEMVRALDGARWDIIAEFLDRPTLPSVSGGVNHVLTTVQQGKQLQMGLLVIVTSNGFIRAMVSIAAQISPVFRSSCFVCDTAAAAEAVIQKNRTQTDMKNSPTSVRAS